MGTGKERLKILSPTAPSKLPNNACWVKVTVTLSAGDGRIAAEQAVNRAKADDADFHAGPVFGAQSMVAA